jgi:hypothetical protein
MTITNPVRGCGRSASHIAAFGPRAAFAATIVVCGLIIGLGAIPFGLLMPVIGSLLFVLAAVFALVAWARGSTDASDVTYWDVAGAVTLVGLCATALVEPDQLVRLVVGVQPNPAN